LSRIRIIGGEWRRRLINVPAVQGLRPTPDRVRETLFNWLGQDLTGLACLDLFAGSGVLGFEAASRGARIVTLVEQDQRALGALRQNARALAADRVEFVHADALNFLAATPQRYDVAFLDPPFRLGWLDRLTDLLPRALSPEAVVYVEAEHPVARMGDWWAAKRGRAGQVHYQLLRKEESA
jgi:16S rRNA (guanine(966)-N(2))-methyltransferase RsmD